MSVTKDEVNYIADLARLQLDDQEAQYLAHDMNRILEFVETLNELDTEDVEPLEHVIELETQFREDKVGDQLPHEEALKNAPDADSDYIRVPRVIE
ncbi:MAG: Asp-tRNA(Asn)/Glu-tRNA(Gln) amidotransferase subunit GatC [Bacteroidota bacterium]